MLNRIIIMGRLTRDPELRRTQSGIAVTSFRVAVDRDFRGPNGEQETDFIDVVAWRNQAEFVSKYFSRGRMIIVEGQLQIRDWTDKEGQKRRNAEIVADRVRFGESKRDADSEYGGSGGGYGSGSSYGSGGSSYGSGGGYGSGYGSTPSGGYGSGYGGAPSSGAAPGYGGGTPSSGSAPGYGSAPSSGSAPGYGGTPSSGSAPGYGSGTPSGGGYGSSFGGGSSAPGYGGSDSAQSDFGELGEEDGDLPF